MDSFDEDDDDLLAGMELDFTPAQGEPVQHKHKQTVEMKSKETEVPDTFPFPFEPYQIQQDFMVQLYRCLHAGNIGIFESPTGTGKSLSLICGALKWLHDFQEKQKQDVQTMLHDATNGKEGNSTIAAGEVDWVTTFMKQKEQEEKLGHAKREQELITKRENRLKTVRSSSNVCKGKRKLVNLEDEFSDILQGASAETQKAFSSEMEQVKRRCLDESSVTSQCDDDSSLVPEDYESDEEKTGDEKDDDEDETCHVTKIYYCSRTHSQLAQFVREIIKSPYGDNTRVISIGSRQNLCINESVRRLKANSLINDRCLELQQKKSKSKPGCPFRKQEMLEEFADKALLELCDIEQLVTLGRQTKTCPYYGSRLAIPGAEVVALPYNSLLHKATREASGVKLAGNIIIVDEAHNLLETINSVHSVEVTGAQLLRAFSQLTQYEARFRSRLKAKNLMYVKQIIFVLSSLLRYLGGKTDIPADKQHTGITDVRLLTINNFLFESKVDNLNLFKIVSYCHQSQISKKLNGFVEKYAVPEVVQAKPSMPKETATTGLTQFLQTISKNSSSSSRKQLHEESPAVMQNEWTAPILKSPLMHIEGFLLALTSANDDGRVVINKQTLFTRSSIKFLLLNPAVHFADVLKEARAVIVAGGTMQPISEFKDQLFYAAGLSPERIMEFSCGHVVPSDHLLALSLAAGPTGIALDFTYQARDSPRLIEELGRALINVCNVVPGGVVVFFPSYDYEQRVSAHWQKCGVLARLDAKKKVFREPKNAVQVENILNQYSCFIQKCKGHVPGSPTGAVLMCVVGGKMSEGINFSDDLGRCVVMVGMPYPNIKSPELKEKMDYLNNNFPRDDKGRQAGQVHYENLCMKAVNQSIGRAIRHREDYAVIVLADQRYARPSVTCKLPTWISHQINTLSKFPPAMSAICKFFAGKRDKSKA